MRRFIMSLSLTLVVLLGLVAMMGRSTAAQDATPAGTNPSAGERDHIDLAVHFAWEPELIAHHWCKAVAGGFFECLIYASDDPDAPLVAVEEVVDEATYQGFDPVEQRLWHSNVAEAAAGSDPNRPAPSLEEAAAEAAAAGGRPTASSSSWGTPRSLATFPWARRG